MSKLKITIQRSRWVTNRLVEKHRGPESSYCAVGFCCKQLGFTDEEITCVSPSVHPLLAPQTAHRFADAGLEWLLCPVKDGNGEEYQFQLSRSGQRITKLNDDASNPNREEDLKALFANHGTELEFVD